MTLTGAIFCGGQSSRMGRDKASLELSGRPMVLWVETAMRAAGIERIYTVGGQTHSGLPSLSDSQPHAGPLSALIDAIEAFGDVFVCPCDVPLISGTLIGRIVAAGRQTEKTVVLAQSQYLQPLIGLYKEASGPMLKAGYEQGARGPKHVLREHDFETMEATDDELQNINTPQELHRAAEKLNSLRS